MVEVYAITQMAHFRVSWILKNRDKKMNNDFEITFFSDSKYKEITAEISYKDQILCQLNKDKGFDNIEIEFFSDARVLVEQDAMKFSLNSFLQILTEATEELKIS